MNESKPITATVTREIWDSLVGHTHAGLSCYLPAYAISEAAHRALRRAGIRVREVTLMTDCHQLSGSNPKLFFLETGEILTARPLQPMADIAIWLADSQSDGWDSRWRELSFTIGDEYELPKHVRCANGGAPVDDRPSLGSPLAMPDAVRYRELRSEGRCGSCGGLATEGQSICADCTAYQTDRRNRLRDEGRCIKCGEFVADGEYSQCVKCRKQWQAVKRLHRASGRCTDCGRESGEYSRCKPCRHKRRLYKLRRLSLGIPKWRGLARRTRGLCHPVKFTDDCGRPVAASIAKVRIRIPSTSVVRVAGLSESDTTARIEVATERLASVRTAVVKPGVRSYASLVCISGDSIVRSGYGKGFPLGGRESGRATGP